MTTTFKQRLTSGEILAGMFCCTYSPQVSEILGNVGLDFLLFDNEHTPNNAVNLHAQLCALAGQPTVAVVRLPMIDEFIIKSALDIGVQCLMIPNVKTCADIERLVKYSFYPPLGKRGIAGSVRASTYGLNKDYLHQANDDISLIIQIESLEGIDNLAAMLNQFDAIDAVFIGPHDLAADMGLLGHPTHPKVVEQSMRAIDIANSLNKTSGILCGISDVAKYQAAGASVFVLGSDIGTLAQTTKSLTNEFKKSLNIK